MKMFKAGELPTRIEVLEKLYKTWNAPIRTETIPTQDAYDRVLSENVFSKCDKPVVRASQMDGVAVKSEAFSKGIPDTRSWVYGVDWTRADTGDDFPDEFDAVIAIEDVNISSENEIAFGKGFEPKIASGTNVSPQGSMLSKGAIVAKKGTRLSPCDIAAVALSAVTQVQVYKRPTVAFIPTGSELIPLGETPLRGQTVDSNSLLAKLMLEEMGAIPDIYPIVRDDKSALAAALDTAISESDIVVFSAGTSKGEEDFSHALLAERGELICHGVAAAPGRPLALAIIDGKPVINVPGPPVACYNGLDWCVRSIISAYSELIPPKRLTIPAQLAEAIPNNGPGFETIIRIELEKSESGFLAHPVGRIRPYTDGLGARGLYSTKLEPEPTDVGDKIDVEILYPIKP
jgi:molybdopterin molybdotransferase/putative molybdopterin biosynthesis protein